MSVALLALLAWLAVPAPVGARPLPSAYVLVVTAGSGDAYDLAVDGLMAEISRNGQQTELLRIGENPQSLDHALQRNPVAVVAVGSTALRAVARSGFRGLLFATMVLASSVRDLHPSQFAGVVLLDVDYARVLTRLKTHFPHRRRIAIIRGPETPQRQIQAIRDEALRLGYELEVVPCASARDLLASLNDLLGRVHFIWCLPERSLYQGKVASSLILETLRSGTPLIGYSEGMVKAGALVGFYPDYRQIGLQTSAMVSAHLQGRAVSRFQNPGKISMAVNERVMRVLGIEVNNLDAGGALVLR